MPKGRQEGRRLQRDAARASAKGECVFHALLAGLSGLAGHEHVRTYPNVLATVRRKLRSKPECLGKVVWNGSSLKAGEIAEFEQAVLRHIHVGDGYLCSACDPLLASYSAAFGVNVMHDFAGTETMYRVPGATRTVYMSSSVGHMEHERNQDHTPDPICIDNERTDSSTAEVATSLAREEPDILPRQSKRQDQLQIHRSGDAPLPFGQWVLVQAEDLEDCHAEVGILRQAQGRTRGKILARDGRIVFFSWAGATVTSFATQPSDEVDGVCQVLALIRHQRSLVVPEPETWLGRCLPNVDKFLERKDLILAFASSIEWHCALWSCLYTSLERS